MSTRHIAAVVEAPFCECFAGEDRRRPILGDDDDRSLLILELLREGPEL